MTSMSPSVTLSDTRPRQVWRLWDGKLLMRFMAIINTLRWSTHATLLPSDATVPHCGDASGNIVTAAEDFTERGRVILNGMQWDAIARTPVKAGQRMKVTHDEGIMLFIAPLH